MQPRPAEGPEWRMVRPAKEPRWESNRAAVETRVMDGMWETGGMHVCELEGGERF